MMRSREIWKGISSWTIRWPVPEPLGIELPGLSAMAYKSAPRLSGGMLECGSRQYRKHLAFVVDHYGSSVGSSRYDIDEPDFMKRTRQLRHL